MSERRPAADKAFSVRTKPIIATKMKKGANQVSGINKGQKENNSEGLSLDMGDADDSEFERF